ncbi:MAG: hypothetical protein KAS73_00345, partial [Candidatus Sabulitectum sp.]|nr:hypothetical protein [Candidatus Sabulitectum sp.]
MERNFYSEIIDFHFAEYPHMQLQDLYKLVYQGVMGSGHALNSAAAGESWLSDELHSMGRGCADEKVVERLSLEIARVNLRPFVASGGDTGALLHSFIRTGREYCSGTVQLSRAWSTVAGVQNTFDLSEMNSFIRLQEASGFPAVHHSNVYRKLYRPAYRVVCIK